MENEKKDMPMPEAEAPVAAEPQEEKAPIKKKGRHKKHKKGGVKLLIMLIAAVLIAVTIVGVGFMLFTDYLGISGSRAREVTVEVPQGTPASGIAELLEDAGVINYPLFFRLYSKVKGYDSTYQYGVYTFTKEDGYSAIADRLMHEGYSPESIRVTIPERASVDKIAEILATENEEGKKVCEKSDFYAALKEKAYDYGFIEGIPESAVYYLFEGYLFPETYEFYCYDSAECATLAVDKMLGQMDKILKEEKAAERAEEMGYTLHEVITMASIVELEASGQPKEMGNVAQVFYNRLENWDVPLLGSSPTAKYPYGSGRYDTNKKPGLPPGPYCSPSLNAIRAALHPNTECKATYFVTDASMNFYYTYSLKEHQQIIKKLKAEDNWIYETY
jgi:UPF0755 protein